LAGTSFLSFCLLSIMLQNMTLDCLSLPWKSASQPTSLIRFNFCLQILIVAMLFMPTTMQDDGK